MEIEKKIPLEDVNTLSPIADTRLAYRKLGKKSGRYRPSAEALLRRVVTGKGLYRINNVVDLINYISIASQYSIGGYDAERIEGAIELGRGRKGEPYEAIARGLLNIENLPVLRDEKAAFGSPTSDSVRTSIALRTKKVLVVFYNFGGKKTLRSELEYYKSMFYTFCGH